VSEEARAGADAVVVATMGTRDEEALADALALSADYVALVASARRAATVLAGLGERGVSDDELARVRSPAGLDLGPCSQEEIAVAVLAELVAWRHARTPEATLPAEAVDPVCGMTVAVDGAAAVVEHAGVTYYFCSGHCRATFVENPDRFPAQASS
jgi:xanthine dehydrogenase accessory factor